MQAPVKLVGLTQVDWKPFITLCQETLGYSPTRGLDACATPTHQDPAAFVASLDLLNKPHDALREGRRRGLFRHYFINFMMLLEESETLQAINQSTELATFATKAHRDYLTLVSGTVEQWHDAVLAGCTPHVEWEFRMLMNAIYQQMLTMGFREIFPYKRNNLHDKTFALTN